MSDKKFTPGPWGFWEEDGGMLHKSRFFEIVRLVPNQTYTPIGQVKSRYDAHLIAAAPELYEALEESNRHLVGELGINHPLVKANRQALAKARGEM